MFKNNNFFLIILLVIYLLHILYVPVVEVDDAFISFRYVKNFCSGKGLVYNPGEYVEGYSNFLWILILSGFYHFCDNLPALARFIGIILGFINLLFFYKVSKIYLSDRFSKYCVLLLALCPQYIIWVGAGLEYSLVILLLLLIVYYIDAVAPRKNYLLLTVLFLLFTLTRPESIGLVLIIFIILFFKNTKNKQLHLSVMIFITATAGLFLLRYSYYNDWLPNTYYAKSGFGYRYVKRGFLYIASYLKTFIFFTTLLPVYFYSLKKSLKRNILLHSIILGYIIFIVCVGGDHAVYYRFFVPIIPFYLIINLEQISRIKIAPIRRIIIILFAVLLLYPSLIPGLKMNKFLIHESKIITFWKEIGLYLKETADKNNLLCVANAGVIPYYSELKTIDSYGLTNKIIATSSFNKNYFVNGDLGMPGHERSAPNYIFSLRPDYYLGSPVIWTRQTFSYEIEDRIFYGPGDYELHKLIKNSKEYEFKKVRLKKGYLFYYKKNANTKK